MSAAFELPRDVETGTMRDAWEPVNTKQLMTVLNRKNPWEPKEVKEEDTFAKIVRQSLRGELPFVSQQELEEKRIKFLNGELFIPDNVSGCSGDGQYDQSGSATDSGDEVRKRQR